MSSTWTRTNVDSDICLQLDDLLNDFALGTLDPETTNFVATHLAECPDVAAHLTDLDAAIDLLGMGVPAEQLDGALWQRIQAEIAPAEPIAVAPKPSVAPTPIASARVREFRIPRWLAAAAAVLLVALTASTMTMGMALRNRNQESDAMESTMAYYMTSGGNVIQLASHEIPGHEDWWGKGALLIAPDMPPVLILDNCEAMNKEKTYVVWLQEGGERTGMGQIAVNDDGRGMMTITGIESLEGYDMIGVSVKMDDGNFYDLMEAAPHQDL